jgi:hypothetical protein
MVTLEYGTYYRGAMPMYLMRNWREHGTGRHDFPLGRRHRIGSRRKSRVEVVNFSR